MATCIINGVKIYYTSNFTDFNPERPVLFCFHGNSSIAETFYRIAELTSGFLQVIAPDLPGCGRSARLASYSMESIGEIVSLFVKSFNSNPRTTYSFGHSLGGHLIAFIDYPFANIILAGTPPLSNADDFVKAFSPDPEAVELLPFLSSHEQFTSEIARKFVVHTGVTGELLILMCAHAESTDGLFRSGCLTTLATKNQFVQIEAMKNVIIIHAESDGVINLDYLMKINKECLFENKIHIVPGKHMSPVLQSELIVKILRRAFNL
uniref:AB hydrolase-1 domain-containing protein n=1 Tax=viral metagenome TaxID=1070528 RepID=A0A6C0C671_9ZZZZ